MGRRTVSQGVKRRGILPSFGDMVLPIVSIAAVGLLILAGRQFFINGMKSSPGITSTRAFADSPALIAEREKSGETLPVVVDDVQALSPDEDELEGTTLAVSNNAEAPLIAEAITAIPEPQIVQKPSPSPVKKHSAPKTASVPASKQWRVQTGAYTSRAGAQEAANKIKKAGFKATVYQNPASKHFKVWVQGGTSKYQAGLVVEAMKKLGYKQSFSFPPMKQ